jgi:hypothetical protein
VLFFNSISKYDTLLASFVLTEQTKPAKEQCFHNRSFKNHFTISKIPLFPQNFLATQTVEKIKKIQAI